MNKNFKFLDLKTSLIFSFFIHILFYLIFSYLSVDKPTCMPIPIEIMDIKTSQKILVDKNLNSKISKENINKKTNENYLEKKEIKKEILTKKNDIKNNNLKESFLDKTNKNNFKKNIEINRDDSDDEILNLSDESNIIKTKNSPQKNIEKTNSNAENSSTEVKFEKEFPFDYYAKLITKKIKQNWEKPFIPGATAKTIIYFKILKNGEITDIKIYQKSKYENFDKSAMIAIIESNKLPELPTDYKENILGVYFAFEFL